MQDIYTANADGTNEQLIAEADAGYCCPKWSPDRSRMTVMVNEQSGGPLRGGTTSGDGSEFAWLPRPDDTLNLVPQAWSPDGQRTVNEGWDDGDASRTGAYTMRIADGSDLTA